MGKGGKKETLGKALMRSTKQQRRGKGKPNAGDGVFAGGVVLQPTSVSSTSNALSGNEGSITHQNELEQLLEDAALANKTFESEVLRPL